MGCWLTTFDVETFLAGEIQLSRPLTTTELAKILSRVPKKYRDEVAGRLSELHN
jgi:hypothetical protein|tara:strand:- start:184 stop:345 length:162 start_codon:yes stop_codon:yes gene_type:complete